MDEPNKTAMRLNEPWTQLWPEENLEQVKHCPVCGERDRRLLHAELVDNVFRVAPGKWSLYQCKGCRSAYLDPRPTQSTVGRAYEAYYTHNASQQRDEPEQLVGFRRLRRALANGYLNARYGTRYNPASRLGPLFARVLPSHREALDVQYRWLPKPESGQRLLDVGCGNGAFLLKAREAGWQVMGVDPDPNAVATARQSGLDVHAGSIEIFDGEVELFHSVTLSHVIEHIHDPMFVLTAVHRLLKPGGTLYIDTPNIQSHGSKIFGPNWRGIEAPRHLVLFSIRGLQWLLQRIGFKDVELKWRRSVLKGMFLSSYRLAQELSPYLSKPKSLPIGFALLARCPFIPTVRLEFITLTARKEML